MTKELSISSFFYNRSTLPLKNANRWWKKKKDLNQHLKTVWIPGIIGYRGENKGSKCGEGVWWERAFGWFVCWRQQPFSASVCLCVCVCLEMAGLELPDVEWATCLSGPKHRNFPLTAEINQSQGNLYSKARREDVCVFVCVYLWEDEYFFICVHDYRIPV